MSWVGRRSDMAHRRRRQPPPTNEDEKVVLVVEEEGKRIDVNDYAAAAAFRSRATRSISPTTAAAANSSSSLYSSSSSSSSSTAATSLAAKAIRASSAAHSHRDSALSSAYAHSHPVSRHTSYSSSSSASISDPTAPSLSKGWDWGSHSSKPSDGEQASIRRNLNEAKQQQQQQQQQGFWGNLAMKAKSLLDADEDNPLPSPPQRQQQHQHIPRTATKPRYQNSNPNYESHQKKENPALQKSLNAISSSISYIGNAVEEGLTVVENRTAGIIQETRKHIKSKSIESTANSNQGTSHRNMRQPSQRQTQMPPQMENDIELQLKASRDVAMAMAAKAKLLLRELKTVKADLAFAKDRCAQLEEENKILRENYERGDSPEDDDLIRLQLETLLAEKARLARENSVYARENRFLREVVEYHQLTMQDVVYLDEGTEEVTEVYPIKVVSNSHTVNTPSPPLPTESSVDSGLRVTRENSPRPVPPPGLLELS